LMMEATAFTDSKSPSLAAGKPASVLPSGLYADTSHPLAEGYASLAQQLLETPAFQSLARK
ncbi:MAG: hypothetical protein JSW27_04025, partial [Phycisphaerales bacterium]